MNALTLRTLATFPSELQARCREHIYDDIDELVQQVALALLQARAGDTLRVIFNRARSACRRFTQDAAHYGRALDGVADTHTPACGGGGEKKREIAREISADLGVTTRRARQVIAAQLRRAEQGDLFADDGSDDDEKGDK